MVYAREQKYAHLRRPKNPSAYVAQDVDLVVVEVATK